MYFEVSFNVYDNVVRQDGAIQARTHVPLRLIDPRSYVVLAFNVTKRFSGNNDMGSNSLFGK